MNKIIKYIIVYFIYYSGILFLMIFIGNIVMKKNRAIILFYHRFKSDKANNILYKLDSKIFEKQLRHLKNFYKIVSINKMLVNIINNNNSNNKYIVISIDDGFKDNYDVAYPILKKMKIPAIIYLSCSYIDTNDAPWVDELGRAIQKTEIDGSVGLELLKGEKLFYLNTLKNKKYTLHRLYKKLVNMDNKTKDKIIKDILKILKYDRKNDFKDRIMLNWNEIKEMNSNGILFGAHTLTHPTLSVLSYEEGKSEILESKKRIEKELGIYVKHFAVPNGRKKDFNDNLREFCRDGLFESVSMTEYGYVDSDTDPFNLPRVHPPDKMPFFVFEIARLLFINR